jgi:hypothetical protein
MDYMKTFYLTSIFTLTTMLTFAQSTPQPPIQNISTDITVVYRLFATNNMYNFIKLNTRNGQMWQVQWSLKDNQFETKLSDISLVTKDEEKNGRFFLYPGISFLIGNQSFIFQNIFFESQIGLALPSIVTAKIGLGFINKGIGASIGMRLYPTMAYAQIHLPTSNGQFNISAEVSPFTNSSLEFYSLSARNLFTVGYQWNIGKSRKR